MEHEYFTIGSNFIVTRSYKTKGISKADLVELKTGAIIQIYGRPENKAVSIKAEAAVIEQWDYDLRGNGSIIAYFERLELPVRYLCEFFTSDIETPMWTTWAARYVCM